MMLTTNIVRLIGCAVLTGASLYAAACATAGAGGPEAIARLERERSTNPQSEPVLRSLGIAYYKSGNLKEARAALDQATKLDPRDGTAALFLGLTAEAQNDFVAARTAYLSYVQYGRTSRVRHALEARLAALQRKQLEETAKAEVRDERRLAQVAGTPNVVAVLPLSFSGADTSLKPLERGLAELLTTDLARSSRLTVVERLRLQAVLDEIKLQTTGATDSSSNVRAGKILQAGRLVQGSILQQGQDLRVDAAVIDVPTTRVAGATNDNRALDQLLTLEKNIALGLFQQMGVTLTTAERNAIEQRPTRSLAAFVAYSRGLLLEDEGQFEAADIFYQNAVRLDPSFSAAQTKSQEARQIIAGNQLTSRSIESNLAGSAEGRVVDAATLGTVATGNESGGTALGVADGLNPTAAGSAATNAAGALTGPPLRDPAASGTGIENIGSKTARIEIVVKRP
ncbi:MAG TPA: tetratricopeptide repeat protein [Gemmatimonadaceae bacterium]|nr:tetratricopeptide repeat protein [Gemmatimonadaceae bacterium]